MTSLPGESTRLHQAVLEAARLGSMDDGTFERLALEVARFQRDYCPGYARALEAWSGGALETLRDIAPVTTDTFRVARVAVHGPELDERRFHTSGTTRTTPGEHCFRVTATMEELSVRLGRERLFIGAGPLTVLGLAMPPSSQPESSLGFMMDAFVRHFDGRPLHGSDVQAGRWLASETRIDVDALHAGIAVARQRGEPVLLLGTSFAFVHLLDALDGARVELPPQSVVMTTGGNKGRTRDVETPVLRAQLCEALGIDDARIVAEYGMTELSSQLYAVGDGAGDGVFEPPPWLRVDALDGATLRPVPEGQPGLACFTDLANVDTALRVLTQDLVVRRGTGVELLGRQPGSMPRGCSLVFDTAVPT